MPTPVPLSELPPQLRPPGAAQPRPVPIWDLPENMRIGMPMPNGNGHYSGSPEDRAIVEAFTPSSFDTSPLGHAIHEGVRGLLNAPDLAGQALANTYLEPKEAPTDQDIATQAQLGVSSPLHGGYGGTSPLLATALRLAPTVATLGIGGGAADDGVANLIAGEPNRALSDVERAGFRSQTTHPIAAGIAGDTGKAALQIHTNAIADQIARNEANVAPGVPLSYETLADARGASKPPIGIPGENGVPLHAGPNAVYNRLATDLDNGALARGDAGIRLDQDPQFQAAVAAAGGAPRITEGSPDAVAAINKLKDRFAAPNGYSGDALINEMRGLRQEGSVNVGTEDVSKQQLGQAQLQMARALEDYVGRNLPENGSTNLAQFQLARQTLAKNYAVQAALRGDSVDPMAIARMQRNDPELLTGGLKAIADFANSNKLIAAPASNVFLPPGAMTDVMGRSPYQSGRNIESMLSPDFLAGIVGAKALARHILTGNTDSAVERAGIEFPRPAPDAFDPIMHTPPPTTGPNRPLALPAPAPAPARVNAPSGVAATEGQLADIGLTPDVRSAAAAHPAFADPNPPVPPAPRGMEEVPFNPPGNYSNVLQPNGVAPAPSPPFTQVGDVMMQGVPEGIVQKSKYETAYRPTDEEVNLPPGGVPVPGASPVASTRTPLQVGDQFVDVSHGGSPGAATPPPAPPPAPTPGDTSAYLGARSADAPASGATVPPGVGGMLDDAVAALYNLVGGKQGKGSTAPYANVGNANGSAPGPGGAGSVERINALANQKAKGQSMWLIDPDGNRTPLDTVDGVDRVTPPGHIKTQMGIGADPESILDRGGLSPLAARGLLARAQAQDEQLAKVPPGLGDLLQGIGLGDPGTPDGVF